MPLEKKTVQSSKGFDLSRISSFRTEIYGFSALWICLYQVRLISYSWPVFLVFFTVGNIGADIFLFLSGISQYHSYTRNRHLADFYRKRGIRLWVPVLSIGTVFSLYYFRFLKHYGQTALVQAMDRKLFIPSFWYQHESQIWFAALLLAAYLLFPLFYHFIYCKTGGVIVRTGILLSAMILLNLHLACYVPDYFDKTKIAWNRFPVFAAGILAGFFVMKRQVISRWAVAVCPVIFTGTISYLAATNPVNDLSISYLWRFLAGISLAVFLPVVFGWLEKTPGRIINRFLRMIGSMSFEVYLVHLWLVIIYIYGNVVPYQKGNLGIYLIIVLISLLISRAFYRLDEWLIKFLLKIL